jgi:uncharacterized membrane protein
MPQGGKQAPINDYLHQHIALIARHEQEFLAQRTGSEVLGDRMASFIGSLTFIAANLIVCVVWVVWNVLPSRLLQRFDSFPFPLLNVLLALEAILVASFILMRQSRISRRAEERDHLMLQMLLLTEREITALVGVERVKAQELGIAEIGESQELREMSQQTPVDEVAQVIKESLPIE